MKEHNNKSLLVNYFLKNTKLSKESIFYIIDLLFKDAKNADISLIESTLLKKYRNNATKIKITSKNIDFACNIKELLLLLNNSNSYVLFENIDNSNYVYYSVIWQAIHS